MPELLTAWVTLTATTKDMKREISRALEQADRNAKITPKVDTGKLGAQAGRSGQEFGRRFSAAAYLDPRVDTSRLAAQGGTAGREFGSKFSAAAKTGLAAVGIGAGIAGLVNQFQKVMSVGMDWTTNMNTLAAVTGASADELQRAGAAARALGNDITIPATSANDAAAAMTELAKGGFTVQQSMDAAQGSLRLAAAAGISAADAATIQSQALQAFGLKAGDAGKMSDTLANAANASSAEIVDVAQAMQQAGTVANQFGLSAEDTASAIALLANNGIKGSDAGTLLKTSLLALTDQGNPAQSAIQELGLTVYDAQGKFVGLHDLMSQLGQASKTMTPEMYQAATATLFGSDAMRFAGVAAKDGAQSYDQMRAAIDRQGAAADVAAAKTKGLPGAWERVKNGIESLQLKTYDTLEGPVTGLLNKLSTGLDGFGDSWTKLAQNPAVQSTLTQTKDAFASLAGSAKEAWPAIASAGKALAGAAGAIGLTAWKALVTALQATAGVLDTITPLLRAIGGFMSEHQGLVTAAATAWLAFKTVPAILGGVRAAVSPVATVLTALGANTKNAGIGVLNFGGAYRDSMRWVQQANPDLSRAGAHMAVLRTNSAAAARAGLSAVSSTASSAAAALGGPLNIALMGAGAAFAYISSQNAAADQAMRAYNEAVKASAESQRGLNDALLASSGLMDEAAKGQAANRIGAVRGELDAGSQSSASFLDQFRDDQGSLWGGFRKQIFDFNGTQADNNLAMQKDMLADTNKSAAAALDTLKLSQEQLAAQTAGDLPVFQALVKNLENQGAGGFVAAEKLKAVREQILGAQAAGAAANPVLKQLGDDVVQSAANIRTAFSALPGEVPISIDTPGGQAAFDLLKQLGQQVSTDNDKHIKVDAPLAPEVLTALKALGFEVRQNNDKTITVKQVGAEAAGDAIDRVTQPRTVTVTIQEKYGDVTRPEVQQQFRNDFMAAFGRADGAIVPMAGGGLRWISKPASADIYAGRGAGTIFAEQETGGEAYIPLAPGKRGRSRQILAEVARLFGMTVMADGGITVEALKEFASGIGGRTYSWGAGNGDTFDTDCSGAQSTVANFITGGQGRFGTADEATALLSRGFQQGDPPAGIAAYWVGWRNGGPGGGHTAGTIVDPLGGNVNVEMGGRGGAGQYGSGAAGAADFPSRAWIALAGGDDPSASSSFAGGYRAATSKELTAAAGRTTAAGTAKRNADQSVDDHTYRRDKAQQRLDEATAAGKDTTDAQHSLDVANRELADARDRQTKAADKLTTAQQDEADLKTKGKETALKQINGGGNDASSFGQSLFSGLLQGMGLDGSVFSNPFDWPNVKSAMALANWGGNLIKNSGSAPDGDTGGGGGLPNLVDLLRPTGPQALTPLSRPDEPHPGTGALPGPAGGPTYVVQGNVGMDPRALTQRFDSAHNQSWRRNMASVRPGQ